MTKKFTKDVFIADILEKPEFVEILKKHNFPCVTCPMARFEMEKLKIGEVCKMYDIDEKKLIKDLNSESKSEEKR